MKQLRLLKEEIDKCVRCGTCRSICPTFRVLGRETASARGKLTLIQSYINGEIGLGEAYIKHIKECTLCGGCKQSCPNGVDTTGIINSARADAIEKEGVPFAASVIFKSLQDTGKFMPWALKMATRLQGLLFRDATAETGLISRFSLPVIGGNRLVPPFAKTFFLDMPEVKALSDNTATTTGRSSKPLRVAFYAGCGINYLMPEVGASSLEVLKRAGAEVIVPSGQVCCGMPAYSMGDIANAKSMALKNLEVFDSYNVDFITTSCATCGNGLKKMFKDLLGDDPETKARVEAFSSKVRDITELLVNELHFRNNGDNKDKGRPRVVTYHDPCHLNRAQGIRNEPRELLKNREGLAFREMSFPCSCCGLGGGLSLANYELSIEITRRKIESIRDSGAEIVATACPGCMVQIRDGLHRYGVNAKVAHVVELL